MALSSKFQDQTLTVVDRLTLETIKTKAFAAILADLSIDNALIVTSGKDPHLELSSRNLPDVKILRTEGLNVYDVLKYNHLVLLEPSIKQIEGRLA